VQYVNNVHYGDMYFRKWMRTRQKVGSLLLQKATHDFDIINSLVGADPVSVAAFGARKVFGGDKPNDLVCDDCAEKWACPQSVYRRRQDAGRGLPPRRARLCVYASEIDINDTETAIIQYANGVVASYSQTFYAPQCAGRRGGSFIGSEGILDLNYYHKFIETPQHQIIKGDSSIDIRRLDAKPGSVIHEVYDWNGHGHFDGTEYGMEAKLALLRGEKTEVENTIREGYVSAKMCLAAQESIETGKIVRVKLAE